MQQYSEETTAAVAKAIEQVNEGWQRKIKQMQEDVALRKWCVEQSIKAGLVGEPAVVALNLYRFIIDPFLEG